MLAYLLKPALGLLLNPHHDRSAHDRELEEASDALFGHTQPLFGRALARMFEPAIVDLRTHHPKQLIDHHLLEYADLHARKGKVVETLQGEIEKTC